MNDVPVDDVVDTTMNESSVDESSVDESSVDESSVDESSVDESSVDESSVDEPTVDKPTGNEPTGNEPTGEESGITLVSSDGESFVVTKKVACTSNTIKNMLEGTYDDDMGEVPLPNIDSKTLLKVITYMKYESEHPTKLNSESSKLPLETIRKWDIDFFDIEKKVLFSVLNAGDYLDIPALVESSCKTIAGIMAGKTPVELRKEFGIPNTWKPGEEEKVKKEFNWLSEGN